MAERVRQKPIKRLEICPVCTGYMNPQSAIEGQKVGGRHWKDETYHRSFGGKELRKFVCEKCGHIETYQVDNLDFIGEDE